MLSAEVGRHFLCESHWTERHGVGAGTYFLSITSALRVYQSLPGPFGLSITAFLQLQIDFGVVICVEHPTHLPLCHDVLSTPQVS